MKNISLAVWSVVALSFAAGCKSGLKHCTTSAECGAGFHCQQEVCVTDAAGDAGGGGGGGGIGGGGGSGGGGAADPCLNVSCPSSAECSAGSCVPRYSGLALTGPLRTNASTVTLTATLTVGAGRTAADPAVLSLSALLPDAGTASVGPLSRLDAGVYSAGIPVSAEGTWQFTASFPDAGLSSAAVVIGVDRTGPRLTLAVAPPPGRLSSAALTEADPLLAGAHRRDEVALLTITSSEVDLSAASVLVTLGGTNGSVVTIDGGFACDAGVFCRLVPLDFSKPGMNADRAAFSLAAVATDDLGNSVVADGGALPVTRWKWRRDAGSEVRAIALDELGSLYLSNAQSLTSQGQLRWDQGESFRHVMVGAADAGGLVYFHGSWSSALAQATWLQDGGPSGYLSSTEEVFAAPVLTSTRTPADPTDKETVYAVGLGAGGNEVLASRYLDPGIYRGTLPTGAAQAVGRRGVCYVSTPFNGRIEYVDVLGGTVISRNSVLQGGVGGQAVFNGTRLLVGAVSVDAALVSLDVADGGATKTTTDIPRIVAGANAIGLDGLVLGDDRVAHLDYREVPAEYAVCSAVLGTTQVTCINPPAGVTVAVAGAGGMLYIRDASLGVRQQGSLIKLWDFTGPPVQDVVLDCSRNARGDKLSGRPGVIYFSSGALVHAVVVDSPGVAPDAPWPMKYHDPRRTNSAETSLAPFSCP